MAGESWSSNYQIGSRTVVIRVIDSQLCSLILITVHATKLHEHLEPYRECGESREIREFSQMMIIAIETRQNWRTGCCQLLPPVCRVHQELVPKDCVVQIFSWTVYRVKTFLPCKVPGSWNKGPVVKQPQVP